MKYFTTEIYALFFFSLSFYYLQNKIRPWSSIDNSIVLLWYPLNLLTVILAFTKIPFWLWWKSFLFFFLWSLIRLSFDYLTNSTLLSHQFRLFYLSDSIKYYLIFKNKTRSAEYFLFDNDILKYLMLYEEIDFKKISIFYSIS